MLMAVTLFPRRRLGNMLNPAGRWRRARGASEHYADADGAGNRRSRAVAARVGGTRRLSDEHRRGRREGAKRIVRRIECVLDQTKELQVRRELIGGVEIENKIGGGLG